MYPVVENRNGKLYHQDLRGRFHFKSHEDYLMDRRTYIPRCICGGWVHEDEARAFSKIVQGRNGHLVIHEECQSEDVPRALENSAGIDWRDVRGQ